MYQVFANGTLIHDPSIEISLMEDPTVGLSESSAGSFVFSMDPTNPGYTTIKEKITTIRVVKSDGAVIFQGVPLKIQKRFNLVKTVTCEGDLAFFLDSKQPPGEFHDYTVRGFVEHLIEQHNNQVKGGPIDKTFELGICSVTDPNDSLYRYTNWEDTLTCLKDKVIDRLGGRLRVRYAKDSHGLEHRYLDVMKSYDNTNLQTIEFGENLLDYAEDLSAEDIATQCVPLGAQLDESPIEALEAYTTVESVNGGSPVIQINEAVRTFGAIRAVVHFDDVHTPSILLLRGQEWLQSAQYANLTLSVSAVDLSALDADIEAFKLGDEVRCLSSPHGMDRTFPVTEQTIHLLKPGSDTLTLGGTVKTFTGRTSSDYQATYKKIERIPSKRSILKQAQDNATALLTAATTGHVVTRPNEIFIMDTDDTETATRVWRWNLNGLGYSGTGVDGPYGLAVTMDGQILGSFIAAGTIATEQISVEYTNAREKAWQDELGNNYWTATNVQTAISNSADSVTASVKTWTGTQYYTKSEINVKTDAITSEVSTKIGTDQFGTLIEQNYSHVRIAWNKLSSFIQFENSEMNIYNSAVNETTNKIISFGSIGMVHYYDGYQVGNIGTNSWVNNSSMRGLVFDLDPDGAYMAWAAKSSKSSSTYSTVLTYTQKTYGDYYAGYLNLGTNLDCQWYQLTDGKFRGNHLASDGTQGTNYDGTLYIPVSTSGIAPGGSYISVKLKDGLLC